MKVSLDVLKDADALRGLVPEWQALADEAAEPNPFYEPWMLLPALEAYGVPGDFACAAVRLDGRLAALFPLQLEARWRALPVRALRSWRHRNMLVGTPLVEAKRPARALLALLQSGLAPLVEFEWTPGGGLFYAALADAASEAGLPWMVTEARVWLSGSEKPPATA